MPQPTDIAGRPRKAMTTKTAPDSLRHQSSPLLATLTSATTALPTASIAALSNEHAVSQIIADNNFALAHTPTP